MTKEQEALKEFYTFCLTTCSERRLDKIKNILTKSREIVEKDLTKLKVSDVVKFLAHINQSDFKAWTKNDYKKIFKRFLKWHYKDLEMIEGKKVKGGFKGYSAKRAFNKKKINANTLIKPKELQAMIRAGTSLKWKAIISFAYESAFRPCEIRALKWKDIVFDDSENIARVFTVSPKTENDRTVPVRDCIVHLKRWKAEYQFLDRRDSDYVFPSQFDRDKPMGDGVITEMFKRLSQKAGIRSIFPYLLRHSRIYEIQKRLPEKIAAKFAGHSIETSEIYNHLADDDVEESMLKEIYVTKELSPEKKHELEIKIQKLEANREFEDELLYYNLLGMSEKEKKGMGVYFRATAEKRLKELAPKFEKPI